MNDDLKLSYFIDEFYEFLSTSPYVDFNDFNYLIKQHNPNSKHFINLKYITIYFDQLSITLRNDDSGIERTLYISSNKFAFKISSYKMNYPNYMKSKTYEGYLVETEEEYFQQSTINDLTNISLADLINVKKIFDDLYKYVKEKRNELT